MCYMLIARSKDKIPNYFGFTGSEFKVTVVSFVRQCKHGFHSLSSELFITELSYFTC